MGKAFLEIILRDLAFMAVCVLIVAPLAAYKKVAWAVLKRNFIGYFSNPTGYVFLCLFVLLTSFAAFWPHEFFTANLANLDQLSLYLPYIMLIFIPASTLRRVRAREVMEGFFHFVTIVSQVRHFAVKNQPPFIDHDDATGHGFNLFKNVC